jgi:exodeoxyribonuclease V alpha subunit
MITRNDYSLGVYNGDIGVCIVVEETPVVYLQGKDGVMKEIQANRLQHFEPAYFMTVHKSQGSEFGHVHLLLPSHDTPVLSRELLYTAVTRASKRFTLHGDAKLFEVGAERKTERFTALASRLHNTD